MDPLPCCLTTRACPVRVRGAPVSIVAVMSELHLTLTRGARRHEQPPAPQPECAAAHLTVPGNAPPTTTSPAYQPLARREPPSTRRLAPPPPPTARRLHPFRRRAVGEGRGRMWAQMRAWAWVPVLSRARVRVDARDRRARCRLVQARACPRACPKEWR